MKKLYLFIFYFLYFQNSQAQYYTQYFDGADTAFASSVNIEIDTNGFNIWQIGTPQKTIFDSAATQPNAIVTDLVFPYVENNVSRFTASVLNDWFSWGIFALNWKQKLDLTSDHDGGIIEFTIDHGLTWQNAFNNPYVYGFFGYQQANADTLATGEYAFSGTDSAWRNIWLCLDLSWMSTFPDTIKFRYSLYSDSIFDGKEGWIIDNMQASYTIIHILRPKTQDKYLNVYPNPSGAILYIEAMKMQEYHIIERMELVNSLGSLVEKWEMIPTRFWIDVRKYQEGNYFLKVKTNFKTEIVPVIICHR